MNSMIYNLNKIFFISLVLFNIFNSKLFCQEEGALNHYLLTGAGVQKITLPRSLNEISGLAAFGSKKILTHDDEEGFIYVYDLEKKSIENKIKIGDKKVREDFEGIAANGDTIFLSTSNGKLFSVLLKSGKCKILFIKKLETKDKIDLEGLCYDEITNSLYLPNKIEVNKKHKDERVIYRFDLKDHKFSDQYAFTISFKELKKKFIIDNFSPTAIEVHPVNNHFIILSSHEKCIVEIDRKGNFINSIKLNSKDHLQPEGLTFLNDNTMIISDEAAGKKAQITLYPYKK
jgi:SdiA-regulated